MLTWKENDEAFASLVTGKTVAIVGPSSTSMGLKEGALIDSFDIVARVKSFKYPVEMQPDLGTRTDILYTTEAYDKVDIQDFNTYTHPSTGESTYRYEKYNNFDQYKDIKFVVSTYPIDEWFSSRYKGGFDELRKSQITGCRFTDSKSYFEAKKKTDRPNSGFSAILDILSFDIKLLRIFGLDFHRAMYREGYQNSLYTHETIRTDTLHRDGPDTHQPDLQYRYFKYDIWMKDDRVNPNDVLTDFLKDDKYDSLYQEKEK